jgi:hypothetical protein
VIVGDDFGWSNIGAFGAEISTPNLDQLAKEGRIGINYHTAPTCSPARTGLLTGVDWHVGGLGNMYELIAQNQEGKPGYETYLNDKVVTVQELLRDAGTIQFSQANGIFLAILPVLGLPLMIEGLSMPLPWLEMEVITSPMVPFSLEVRQHLLKMILR